VQVNPDQTYFDDDYLRHVLYITRIYFRYGEAESELIGKSIDVRSTSGHVIYRYLPIALL